MAVTLVFKKTNAKIDSVTLDASLSETHQAEADVTEHPVEEGVNIVDHVRPKPKMLTIEGIVTNTPVPSPNDPLVLHTQGNVQFQSRGQLQPTRAGQAMKELLGLFEAGRLFTVVTALQTYDNMLLKSLSVPRDITTGNLLKFTAVLVEVQQVASAQTVDIGKKVKLKKRAAPETPEPKKKQSIAYQILDAFAPALLRGAGK